MEELKSILESSPTAQPVHPDPRAHDMGKIYAIFYLRDLIYAINGHSRIEDSREHHVYRGSCCHSGWEGAIDAGGLPSLSRAVVPPCWEDGAE